MRLGKRFLLTRRRMMSMGPAKDRTSAFQHEIVCLDELVPADDRYRVLERLVDFSFIRTAAAPYYAAAGRPSVDPVVLVKIMLVGALEGTRSVREVLRQANMRLDLRRFLGYGLGERLPVHQTLSMALTRRFIDARLFEELFVRSVRLCVEAGLVEGTHVSVDGFHSEADAALSSLRASLGPAPEALTADDEPDPGPAPTPPTGQLRLADPPRRGAPTPPRRSSNRTARSLTDPDARLRHKPGQRPHLVYRGQVAVDPRCRVVVGCLAERATGFEGDAIGPLLDRLRFLVPDLRSLGADQGYSALGVWQELDSRRIRAYIPPNPTQLPPGGRPAATPVQARALTARAQTTSPEGIWAHARRLADAEGVIAEAKVHGTLARARHRGLALFRVQLLIDCAAINCKRLARHQQVGEGQAAGGGAKATATPTEPAARASDGASAAAIWEWWVCLN
jgi:transposase